MSCDCAVTSCSEPLPPPPVIGLIVCGPCACGKSQVASALARHYQVPFVDADSLHSEANIKKMSSGIPLTDEDRFPWLIKVRQQMLLHKKLPMSSVAPKSESEQRPQIVGVVAACSALTLKYRNILRGNNIASTTTDNSFSDKVVDTVDKVVDTVDNDLRIIFVFLNCSPTVLQKRLNERQGHFMKSNMLTSQLATLEVPREEEQQGVAIIVDGDEELSNVVKEAIEKLQSAILGMQ